MDEWTEQEEQQVIERAKAGDPEANYALSLWALRRGEEEPDEPRWNRLAAKCLVKSAQAGYGPAKEQMASLLSQSGQDAQSAPPAAQAPVKHAAPPEEEEPDDARPAVPVRRSAPAARSAARSASRSASRPDARPTSTARRAASRRQQAQDGEEDGFDVNDASWDDDEAEDDASARPDRSKSRLSGLLPPGRKGGSGGGKWGDDKWRKMEFICVVVCAALLIVIAVMIISGKHGDDSASTGGGSAIPPAGDAASAGGSGSPTAGDYPDAATQAAIMAADLDIFPSPEDYVTEATTGAVSVSSEYLRLRKGPNTTYDPIAQMPNETTVSVFAKKNDWDLVLYQGDEGAIYGWCSSEYVILTAGAAAGGAAATEEPGAAEG